LIKKIHDLRVNADCDIFKSMQSDLDQPHKDGKRLFLDRVNNSNDENMYLVDHAQKVYERHRTEFPDKSKINYENPEFSTFNKKTKTSFVHNTVMNKNKANIEHLKNVQTFTN
jgi:hypothetical protein